jgi:hypothetical protein
VKKLIDFGRYASQYKLPVDCVTVEVNLKESEINKPGLLMHGSLKDPYLILKLGLLSHETQYFKDFKSRPQICLGLNNTNQQHTIQANGSLKNTAVKYAEYFNQDGVAYMLSDEVKNYLTYKEEFEDYGSYRRGNAYISEPVPNYLITGAVTKNIPQIMAAMLKANRKIPAYTPDGTEYKIKE